MDIYKYFNGFYSGIIPSDGDNGYDPNSFVWINSYIFCTNGKTYAA